jgi:hypothetical protein
MLLTVVILAVLTMAAGAAAQTPAQPPSAETGVSTRKDAGPLPVSLDRIKQALAETPPEPLRGLDERPRFRTGVSEKQTISIDDLIRSMDFKSGPAVPGGLYGYEVSRQAFPATDNPLQQPYAAFSQPELLTVAIENLAAKYLGGRALDAVSSAERARAEQAARDEVQKAIAEYRAAQAQSRNPKP